MVGECLGLISWRQWSVGGAFEQICARGVRATTTKRKKEKKKFFSPFSSVKICVMNGAQQIQIS